MQDRQMQWAKIGAAVRLEALEQERAAILQAFPEMRRSRMLSIRSLTAGTVEPPRRFSVAARRRMSAGMRKYWARRKAAAKKASAA